MVDNSGFSKDKLHRNGRESDSETCRLQEKETKLVRLSLSVYGCIFVCVYIYIFFMKLKRNAKNVLSQGN